MISKKNRLVGATLLVAGTTIGAGMLALPLTTGPAGFFPALLWMVVIWAYMMLTAFYFLEVNLRMRGETNLISMMHRTLGRSGEAVAWITYLILLYALLAAYMVGCSQILSEVTASVLHLNLPAWVWPPAVFVCFGAFLFFGTQTTDMLNRVLMVGLVVSYLAIIGIGAHHVDFALLTHHYNFPAILAASSVIFTSFGYHIIIPTLTTYLEHDSRMLKKALFFGSLIALVIYVAWQCIAMGIIPLEGEVSLLTAAQKGDQVTFYLSRIVGSPWISLIARFFSFFAIITSVLGIGLSLVDFFADGFKIKKTLRGKCALLVMTFTPPLLFALFYPQGFVIALQYAGICVIILLCLMPALMAYFERYCPKEARSLIKSDFKVPGGKVMIIGTILFALFLLGVEVFK